ncbi:MAG: PAS domain S-box protein [Bacteroidales bacterium]|nr:PAS domain S-box protein [Bacteroidales bacterium]
MYKKLYEIIDVGVVYQNTDGKIYDINPAAEKILGIKKDDISGLDSYSQNWQAIKEDGSPFPGEEHPSMIVLKTGKPIKNVVMGIYNPAIKEHRWIKINAYPDFKEEDNSSCCVFSTFSDITDLIKTKQQSINAEKKIHEGELALEKTVEELEAIINALPGMVSVVDKEFNILIANNEVIKTFGHPKKNEVIGKKCYNIRKGLKYICPQCAIAESFKTGKMVSRISIPEEEELMGIATKAYAIPLKHKNGDIWGGVEVIMDVTDMRRIEKAVMESEERFRTIIEEAADAVFLSNMKGDIINVNHKAEEQTGYTRIELLSMKVMDFDIDHPTLEKCHVFWNSILIGTAQKLETLHMRKDGTTYPVELNVSALNINGEKHILGFARDITERKQAEELLKKQNEEFQALNEELSDSISRIQKINEELEIAKAKAEESDKLKSAFLANMSHEIRTPMNGILGFAELLQEPNIDEDRKKHYVEIIEQSGRRMLSIISDLIDISKIEAGQVEIHNEQTNVNNVIRELLDFFRPEANRKNIVLKTSLSLDDSLSTVETDKTKLNQILTNLLKNALKFTDDGCIEFGYSLEKDFLKFYVKDTGIGIPHEFREIIFDRFKQGENSNGINEGTGLGLSISKAFVELLGGKIGLESGSKLGSTFYFTIPYTHKKINLKEKTRESARIKISERISILVAEDDMVSYLYMKELLTSYKINCIHVKNGADAIEVIKTLPEIKLVFMDIKLPVIDGLTATQEIKKIRPEIPVIAQTAYAFNENREKALQTGCDDFISKPIPRNKINEIIVKYLK